MLWPIRVLHSYAKHRRPHTAVAAQEASMEEIAALRTRLQSKREEVAEAMQDKWALSEELDRFNALMDQAIQVWYFSRGYTRVRLSLCTQITLYG